MSSAVSRAFGSVLESNTRGSNRARRSASGLQRLLPSSLSRHSSDGMPGSSSGALCRTSSTRSDPAGEIAEAPGL
jgi:hypothetical protein